MRGEGGGLRLPTFVIAYKIVIVLFVQPGEVMNVLNTFENKLFSFTVSEQLGNLLSLCREIAGARDILQKFENLKKQHE